MKRRAIEKPVVLVGMMGSGKSSVGRLLAERLGWRFMDSDDEIEKRMGAEVSEIFAERGEAAFRASEREAIAACLGGEDFGSLGLVLSLGGGAFLDESTRRLVKEKARSAWLKAPVSVLLERIGDASSRPLLREGDAEKTLARLLKERKIFYAQADMSLNTEHLKPQDVARKIAEDMQL